MSYLDTTLVQDYDDTVVVYGASQGVQSRGELITLDEFMGEKRPEAADDDQFRRETGSVPARARDYVSSAARSTTGGTARPMDNKFIDTLVSRIGSKKGAGFRYD